MKYIHYHMPDERKIKEELGRILDRVIGVLENGGETTVENPRVTLFMQANDTEVTISVYTVMYRKEPEIVEVVKSVKIDIVVEANQCFALVAHDPYTRKTSWSINVGAPFKIKSDSGERWGKKHALVTIIKE